jgi:hypothetical protein
MHLGRLGHHATLTGTLLFVMNVFKKNEGFEELCPMQMRKQASRVLRKAKIFQSLFLATIPRDINWQRREY